MSCAFGRRLIGVISSLKAFSSYQSRLISGVTDEVAQVSMISFSGINSVHPQEHGFLGVSFNGFTGRSSISGKFTAPHFLQYQTGKGTPKYRCLDIHQSHSRFSTQLVYLAFMWAGYQLMLSPAFKYSSLLDRMSMNHCFFMVISIGVPQRSCVATL